MGSRRKRAGRPSIQPSIAGAFALVVAGSFIAAILWRSARLDSRSASSPQSLASPGPAPQAAEWALPADLPPLPVPSVPLPRPAVVVRTAYESAARHPEVLGQVPCFCGCRSLGHRSNHDCFVAARDPTGKVAWDAHGMG